jgi:apolipoprotein N-acyltransferase
MITGLLFLQIPSSLIFYPLAAIFAITGVLVPIAMALMGIGTLPFSFAMKFKDRWQGGGVPEGPTISRQSAAAGDDPG